MLEHAGFGNLGDDATVAAVLHNIKLRWPDAEVTGLTLNPSDTQQRHGIKCFAIHRDCKRPPSQATLAPSGNVKKPLEGYPRLRAFLRLIKAIVIRAPKNFVRESLFILESLPIAKSFDLLVISGGGQLRDKGKGPYAFPYTIFKWVALARLMGARCYVINAGAGPLKTRSGKFFLRNALRLADHTSFRDERSRKMLMDAGFRQAGPTEADCVYSLPVPNRQTGERALEKRKAVVGISPMRVYWEDNPGLYSYLIEQLGELGAWLGRNGHELQLFSTELPSDYAPIADLQAALEAKLPDAPLGLPNVEGLENLLAKMPAMDYVVTCRFHGVVFAHLLNIPVLAISHHPKVATLMNDIGLSEYCLDVNSFDSARLIQTFTRLMSNREEVKARMAERAAAFRRKLEHQYDTLFSQPGMKQRDGTFETIPGDSASLTELSRN